MSGASDDSGEIPAPRENPDLHGHDGAEHLLRDSFDAGRLAHAWLISGPEGIGKATLAYRFARYVLSGGNAAPEAEASAGAGLFGDDLLPADIPDSQEEQGPLYVPPHHPVFKRVASGGHSDLMSVERTVNEKTGKLRTEIVVDDIRLVGNFFHHTAGEGGWRVVVIDCADEMNVNAANAVLKVLEEPPAKALLLLVSHNPGRLLPTIRSRCRKLALQPLGVDSVAALLGHWRPELDVQDTRSLAALADGSPGRALALAGEGGLELYRDMLALLETLPRLDVPALHAFGGRLAKSGADEAFHTASGLLRWWLARMILNAATGGGRETQAGGGRMTQAGSAEQALMDRLCAVVNLDRWFEVWEKINHLLSRADQVNLDRKQVVLNVFLTLEDAVRS
ncbi:MAG: DNA polymerase III subunit delta' [Rhodospirillales bacterium]|nr:DNA polymerase III subunit delta' [Alphaproteobacteria bacterium]MBL6948751.1 DNA polymerase III subunit delta' [Rhodospirillales bacterium]